MQLDKIKDQIRKILNLGNNDGATDAEAENAIRFARRLMLKHNIDQADVEEAKDGHEHAADAEAVEYGRTYGFTQGVKFSQWESTLTHAICNLVGTVKFYTDGRYTKRTATGIIEHGNNGQAKKATRIVFYGPEEDTRDARELVDEWSTTIMALARMRFGGVFKGPGRSYCEGFAMALYKKVQAVQREERALIEQHAQGLLADAGGADRCTALVAVNGNAAMVAKRDQAAKWLESECGVKLRKGSRGGGGEHHGDAYGQGTRDGKAANFAHTRTRKLNG